MRVSALKKLRTIGAVLALAGASLFASTPAAAHSGISPKAITYYQFSNYYTQLCLDVAGQVPTSIVQQYTCNGTVNQQWRIVPTDSGYFQLAVASSGRCLEIANAGQGNDVGAWIANCNGGYYQQFTWQTSTHSGYRRLAARHSGYCLQPLAERVESRVQIVQYVCYTAWSQEWRIS